VFCSVSYKAQNTGRFREKPWWKTDMSVGYNSWKVHSSRSTEVRFVHVTQFGPEYCTVRLVGCSVGLVA